VRLPTPGERIVFIARIASGAVVACAAFEIVHKLFAGITAAFAAIP
jgi:hypothetical protein